MPLQDNDSLLKLCLSEIGEITSKDISVFESAFTEADAAGDLVASKWRTVAKYGDLDGFYAACNGILIKCLECPAELRQDLEVALKASYMTKLLRLRNSELVKEGETFLPGGIEITYRPDINEPGNLQFLPILSDSVDACHGPVAGGLLTGEVGLQPGVVLNTSVTAGSIHLRVGVTFGLFPNQSETWSLTALLARGHGICTKDIFDENWTQLILVPIAKAIEQDFPRSFSLTSFIPDLPSDLPEISLFGVTRIQSLVNLHFQFVDRPRRPRNRIIRISDAEDWDYAIMIELSPIKERINKSLTEYDFQKAINDAIKEQGLDWFIDVHITRQEVGTWQYQPAEETFRFDFDLDYDFVLTGLPVKGTLFGEITAYAIADVTGWEAQLMFLSVERQGPEVHCNWTVLKTAKDIAKKISSELFNNIGPQMGTYVIFAPGNIIKVDPRFQLDQLRLDVWAAI